LDGENMMLDFSDPHQVHEALAIALMLLLFPGVVLAMAYLHVLNKFFKELALNEPAVWDRIGAPTVLNLTQRTTRNILTRYFAFLPVLRERAATRDGRYRHAGLAYTLLKIGLWFTAAMFAICGMLIFWMTYHGL